MNNRQLVMQRMAARLEALVLVAVLALMLGGAGWLLGGSALALGAFLAVVALYVLQPLMAPRLMLRIQGGRSLGPNEAPRLYQMVNELTRRAGLVHPPMIYYLPSGVMNAFTVGSGQRAVVGVTDGLLRRLSNDELAAVLAHEIAHIRNNDTRVMGFAALLSQLIQGMSIFGQLLLLVNLPLILTGHQIGNPGGLLVLILAPYGALLLQLALSRSREFFADAEAAALLGSPRPLAIALTRIEQHNQGLRRHLWRWPGFKPPENGLWRTHPPTRERIRRLLAAQDAQLPARAYTPRSVPYQAPGSRLTRCRAYGLCP